MTRLLLVRHGESVVTVRQIVGGEGSCTGLSDLGRRQAEALRDRIRREPRMRPEVVVSSTLPRALQTAQILAEAVPDAPMHVDADLVEHRPGLADGVPFADFADRFGWFDHRAEPDRPMAPGAESLRQFHDRVIAALARVQEVHHGATVLVVCHGGVIDLAFRSFLGLALSSNLDLWTLNTSITEFVVPERTGRPVLRRYNDAAHLAGLPERTPTEVPPTPIPEA